MAKTKKPAGTIEQRKQADRRSDAERRIAATATVVERRTGQRREKVNRRRQIDPTTCERDYTNAEVEFMHALEHYKRTSGRMFPTCSEVLEVLIGLGYEKKSHPRSRPQPARSNTSTRTAASAASKLPAFAPPSRKPCRPPAASFLRACVRGRKCSCLGRGAAIMVPRPFFRPSDWRYPLDSVAGPIFSLAEACRKPCSPSNTFVAVLLAAPWACVALALLVAAGTGCGMVSHYAQQRRRADVRPGLLPGGPAEIPTGDPGRSQQSRRLLQPGTHLPPARQAAQSRKPTCSRPRATITSASTTIPTSKIAIVDWPCCWSRRVAAPTPSS